jgi:hypothetical protein
VLRSSVTWRGERGVITMPLSIIGVLAVPEQPAQQPIPPYPTGVRIMDLALTAAKERAGKGAQA